MPTNGPDRFSLIAGSCHEGMRLDVFLARKLRNSRTWLRLHYHDQVRDAQGRLLKWAHRVRTGERVLLPVRERTEPAVEVGCELLYQDEWLVAVNKAPGAPVHAARSFQTRNLLCHLRQQLGMPDLQLAHRLDRETSGVLLLGRTKPVLTHLMRQFAQGVRKRYLAVVRGHPEFKQKIVQLPLCLDTHFPLRTRMMVDEHCGRSAVTHIEVLRQADGCALVAALPKTGRKHQIRVHLSAMGHPVLGDKLYQQHGKPYLALLNNRLDASMLASLGHIRQALHAERLEVVHPILDKRLMLTSPLPDDLQALLSK